MPKNKTRKEELECLILDSKLKLAADALKLGSESFKSVMELNNNAKEFADHLETYVKRRIELDRLEHGIL